MKAICGPKLSLCCMLLSIWGIIQLSVMGILYYFGAMTLIEDVEEIEEEEQIDAVTTLKHIEHNYKAVAINCWIASGVYILFFIFSMSQFALRDQGTPKDKEEVQNPSEVKNAKKVKISKEKKR